MDPVNIPAKFEVRSFSRSWDNRGYSKKLDSPWIHPHFIFSQIFNRLLFAWILWIYLPNLTFVALPIPEITGVIQQFWESLDSPTLIFSQVLKGFCSHGPWNIPAKFEVRSFTRSWDTQKNSGSPWIRPRSLFSKIFHGLCSDGPCECIGQICSP